MSSRPRVLIADDHKLVADLCQQLLEPQFDVVSVVTNGLDLVRIAMELNPDVILVDIAMPDLNGLEAAAQVMAVQDEVKIIYLTMNSDPEVAMHAFDEGASGFLLKTCAASDLVRAVRTVLRGEKYISPILQKKMELLRWESVSPMPEARRLTPRQYEVLKLIVEGKNMKQIAQSLEMTSRTVAFHKYRIMERLGVKSNADLVKYAVRNGVIPLSEVPAKHPSTPVKEVGTSEVVA